MGMRQSLQDKDFVSFTLSFLGHSHFSDNSAILVQVQVPMSVVIAQKTDSTSIGQMWINWSPCALREEVKEGPLTKQFQKMKHGVTIAPGKRMPERIETVSPLQKVYKKFIAASFTTAKVPQQARCSPAGGWGEKGCMAIQ